MQLDVILNTMHRMPMSGFLLVLFMAIAAALLVNHILKAGYYTTLASVPVFTLSGMFGYAVLTVNGVFLSHDKASNTALSAALGFILFATITIAAMRIMNRLRDKR